MEIKGKFPDSMAFGLKPRFVSIFEDIDLIHPEGWSQLISEFFEKSFVPVVIKLCHKFGYTTTFEFRG